MWNKFNSWHVWKNMFLWTKWRSRLSQCFFSGTRETTIDVDYVIILTTIEAFNSKEILLPDNRFSSISSLSCANIVKRLWNSEWAYTSALCDNISFGKVFAMFRIFISYWLEFWRIRKNWHSKFFLRIMNFIVLCVSTN